MVGWAAALVGDGGFLVIDYYRVVFTKKVCQISNIDSCQEGIVRTSNNY
jgi:hypothetical protein